MNRFGIAAALAVALTACTASQIKAADLGGLPRPLDPVAGVEVSPVSCYVQAMTGAGINGAKASDGSGWVDSVSASGWTAAAGAGCDAKLGRIVVGALARYELPIDQDTDLFRVRGSYMVAARAGYLLNTGLMAYGLAGFSGANWRVDSASETIDGLVLGGGLEVMVTHHVSLTAEYTQTHYGSWHDAGISVEPTAHAARLGLSYRFGSLFGE